MAFGRLHEEAAGDGKLLALSDAAFRMWACGLIYCQKNLTDGFIPEHAIAAFGVRGFDGSEFYRTHFAPAQAMPAKAHAAVDAVLRGLTTTPATIADELCRAQLLDRSPVWERVAGGYRVHDYLDWNDSRAEILEKRQQSRQRRSRYASRNASQSDDLNAVPNADADAFPVVRGSSPDQEKGQDAERTTPPRHVGAGAMGTALPREHLTHAACSPNFAWCVPDAVHRKLAIKLGPKFAGDGAKADRALREWYPTVWSSLPGDTVLPDAFRFWERRFDGEFAAVETAAAARRPEAVSTVPSAEETRRKYLD